MRKGDGKILLIAAAVSLAWWLLAAIATHFNARPLPPPAPAASAPVRPAPPLVISEPDMERALRDIDRIDQEERAARAAEDRKRAAERAASPTPPLYQPTYQPPPPPAYQPPDPNRIVYYTDTGTEYHHAGCRFLRYSSHPIRWIDAKDRYGECDVCGGG